MLLPKMDSLTHVHSKNICFYKCITVIAFKLKHSLSLCQNYLIDNSLHSDKTRVKHYVSMFFCCSIFIQCNAVKLHMTLFHRTLTPFLFIQFIIKTFDRWSCVFFIIDDRLTMKFRLGMKMASSMHQRWLPLPPLRVQYWWKSERKLLRKIKHKYLHTAVTIPNTKSPKRSHNKMAVVQQRFLTSSFKRSQLGAFCL